MAGHVDESTYEQMLRMADGFDALGERLRTWSRTGQEILRDPDVTESAELSTTTYDAAAESIESAALGRGGLLGRSLELDADALAVRATVLTYRWIDELQTAAYRSLGSIAGRAIGFLAPEVELGGSLVSAGMIETDALDRDGVAAYLGDLAAANPELMEHITSGGGGLLDSLQLRSLLTSGMPSGEELASAAQGGLRALGLGPVRTDAGAAIRDISAELVQERSEGEDAPAGEAVDVPAPRGIADLIAALEQMTTSVTVRPAAPGRYIAYLPGAHVGDGRRASTRDGQRLRLVTGDIASYAASAARTIAESVEPGSRVMLVGAAAGGATAAALASSSGEDFVVEQVVTVGAPAAQAARVPESTRVLALEDRNDPVALLGSLVNAGADHRLTVVYDADADTRADGESRLLAGARQADSAPHPELRAELDRMRELGYLA